MMIPRPITYEVSQKQADQIVKWLRSLHRSKKPYYGREVQYIFSPGAIGIGLTVVDVKTGKRKDFTDYDTW